MTDPRLRENAAPRKVVSSARFWRICSCITHLTTGWRGRIPTSRGVGMQMMGWSIAGPSRRQTLRDQLQARLAECRLEMHPTKTKIVYCKDAKRKGKYPNTEFDFLGYCFRPRLVRRSQDGKLFWGFNPAVSDAALKDMRATIRDLDLLHQTQLTVEETARQINPLLRGWIGYYGL
jgi:RNA-directed DNA polymerase